jgi:hypothetical protein
MFIIDTLVMAVQGNGRCVRENDTEYSCTFWQIADFFSATVAGTYKYHFKW